MSEPAGVWRPIETAPRDGTEILIWRDGIAAAPVAKWEFCGDEVGFLWVFDEAICIGVDCGNLGWADDIEDGAMPTHWSPIPAAAKDEGDDTP